MLWTGKNQKRVCDPAFGRARVPRHLPSRYLHRVFEKENLELLISIAEGPRHHSDGQRQSGDGTPEATRESQHPRDAGGQVSKGQGESRARDGDAARQDQEIVRAPGQGQGRYLHEVQF